MDTKLVVLGNERMTPRMVRLIAEIDEFKGYWKGMGTLSPNFLSNLRILATIESIGSSTRIEGAKLSDSEVSALIKGIGVRSFRSRDEQEVAGYAEALKLVQESYDEIVLTENNIKYLHKVLLKFSDKDAWHLGEYKKHPNPVAAFDADGREIGILFKTASPFDTPQWMESLVTATRKNLKDADTHSLTAIADFMVRFLAIHPFQDGKKAPSTPCSDTKTYSPWKRKRIILLSFYQRLLKNFKRTIGRNCSTC